MFDLPSRFTTTSTLVKKDYEHVWDYIRRIHFYYTYRSDVFGEHHLDQPDYVSAMIVQFLPNYPPYEAIKSPFRDFHLPNGVANYTKYKDSNGQWGADWRYLYRYIAHKEFIYLNPQYASYPTPYHNFSDPAPQQNAPYYSSENDDSLSESEPQQTYESWGEPMEQDNEFGDSSCEIIPNPNPLSLPVIINLESDQSDEYPEEDHDDDDDDDDDDGNDGDNGE